MQQGLDSEIIQICWHIMGLGKLDSLTKTLLSLFDVQLSNSSFSHVIVLYRFWLCFILSRTQLAHVPCLCGRSLMNGSCIDVLPGTKQFLSLVTSVKHSTHSFRQAPTAYDHPSTSKFSPLPQHSNVVNQLPSAAIRPPNLTVGLSRCQPTSANLLVFTLLALLNALASSSVTYPPPLLVLLQSSAQVLNLSALRSVRSS